MFKLIFNILLILENLFLCFFHYLIIFSSYELDLHQSLQVHFHLGLYFISKIPLTLLDLCNICIKNIFNQVFSFIFLIIIGKINFLRFCEYYIIIIITLVIKWSHATYLTSSRQLYLLIIILNRFMPLYHTSLFAELFNTINTYFLLYILILLLFIIKWSKLFFLLREKFIFLFIGFL